MDTQVRSDSVASSGSTGATVEGYMLKRSGKKLVKWHKRWFTLRTEVLLYYQTEKSLQSKGNMDLAECRGLRKHTEIRKIKHLPKSADEHFVFGIATKKKVFVVCAPDAVSYNDWTWCLHGAITQYNPEVVQMSLGTFLGNRTDPFQGLGGGFDSDESDESSSEDEAFQPTREESKLDLRTIRSMKRPASKQGARRDSRGPDRKEERVRLVQTPNGLNFSNSKTATEPRATSKWTGPKIALKDRFNAGTDWQESSRSAPTSPVNSKKLTNLGLLLGTQGHKKRSFDPSGTDSKQKLKRSGTPLSAVGNKMRSSLSKLNVSGSMTDLRDILRPGSSLGDKTEPTKGPAMKRSASGNVADEEARAAGVLQECLQEVDLFKEQIERFLGREVLVEQDLTRMVEDRSLHQNGLRRFKGLRETFRSILQNLYKGLVSVAEPVYVRQEAARVLGKFQFTLYQIPCNPKSPQRPASSLMLQTLRGRALEWDCPDPPDECSLHYYLQLQLEEGRRVLDIMTVFQCEIFWENLLRGKESKFALQIETGVAKWQMDLEKLLGRRIGMFVDTAELLKQVPEQTLRYKAAEGVGTNFCQNSLGILVGILEKLVDNQLTQKQLKKRLRYIELGPLPQDSGEDKVVEWRDGGLVVRAKWHNGVKINYADVFQCFESENVIN